MLARRRNRRVSADSKSSRTAPPATPTGDPVPGTATARTTSTVHAHIAQMTVMLTPYARIPLHICHHTDCERLALMWLSSARLGGGRPAAEPAAAALPP